MKYLVRWNDHTAVLNIYGIRRLMRKCYEEKQNLQVAVFKLAESSIYDIPVPVRVWYDWKFDKLSLFSMSGDLVEFTEPGKLLAESKNVA